MPSWTCGLGLWISQLSCWAPTRERREPAVVLCVCVCVVMSGQAGNTGWPPEMSSLGAIFTRLTRSLSYLGPLFGLVSWDPARYIPLLSVPPLTIERYVNDYHMPR